MDFDTLKRNSGAASIEQLAKYVEKLNQASFQSDPRFWFPTLDKAGNGSGIVRFLPPPKAEDSSFVRRWRHYFKDPNTGMTYDENCLTTLGQNDPVTEYNAKLYKSSDDPKSAARQQVSLQKRKLEYISNVLVIKDPAKPECDGKVFLHKYGAFVYDKINTKINPPEDELGIAPPAFNPFDFWTGADFVYRLYKKADGGGKAYLKYDRCDFVDPKPLSDDDNYLKSVWEQEYSLKEFIDPKNFKSYEELKQKFERVIGTSSAARSYEAAPPTATQYVAPPAAEAQTVPEAPLAGPEDMESFFASLSSK